MYAFLIKNLQVLIKNLQVLKYSCMYAFNKFMYCFWFFFRTSTTRESLEGRRGRLTPMTIRCTLTLQQGTRKGECSGPETRLPPSTRHLKIRAREATPLTFPDHYLNMLLNKPNFKSKYLKWRGNKSSSRLKWRRILGGVTPPQVAIKTHHHIDVMVMMIMMVVVDLLAL